MPKLKLPPGTNQWDVLDAISPTPVGTVLPFIPKNPVKLKQVGNKLLRALDLLGFDDIGQARAFKVVPKP